jgi:hypothetical protein
MNNFQQETSKSYCLLLTGTISPSTAYALKRINPVDRENDYYNALVKWMQFKIPMVFCENSNFNSHKIKELTGPSFEFIQYEESEDITTKGKGYGEALIMNYAFAHSHLINQYDYIIKITGRLFINNFKSILKIADPLDFDIMAPLENNLKWSDSRFLIFRKDFFSLYFQKRINIINDATGFTFERALACSIHELLADNKKWEMLPCYPGYKGFSGTYNEMYSIFRHNAFRKTIWFRLFRYLNKF